MYPRVNNFDLHVISFLVPRSAFEPNMPKGVRTPVSFPIVLNKPIHEQSLPRLVQALPIWPEHRSQIAYSVNAYGTRVRPHKHLQLLVNCRVLVNAFTYEPTPLKDPKTLPKLLGAAQGTSQNGPPQCNAGAKMTSTFPLHGPYISDCIAIYAPIRSSKML